MFLVACFLLIHSNTHLTELDDNRSIKPLLDDLLIRLERLVCAHTHTTGTHQKTRANHFKIIICCIVRNETKTTITISSRPNDHIHTHTNKDVRSTVLGPSVFEATVYVTDSDDSWIYLVTNLSTTRNRVIELLYHTIWYVLWVSSLSPLLS